MIVGIPTEILGNESRVAATPQTVKRLLKQGFKVVIQISNLSQALKIITPGQFFDKTFDFFYWIAFRKNRV